MRALFDTSVLIPAVIAALPQHVKAAPILREAHRDGFYVASHALAEMYSVLTTLPLSPRLTTAQAQTLIDQNILAKAEIVLLDADDYAGVIRRMSGLGLLGGAIYDGLHVRAAEKVQAEALYTFNGRDFRRMPPSRPTELVAL